MHRTCPRCRGTSEHFLCPRCGIRTEDKDPSARPGPSATAADPADAITPAIGVLIGLLLAQGLYYALRHLMTALLLMNGDVRAEAEFWAGGHGLVMQQATQALALVVGSMVAAAGQRYGWALGAALGVVNSLLLVSLQTLVGSPPDALIRFGQPLLHAALGAVGGLLGGRIWQPAPPLPAIAADPQPESERLTTAGAVADELPDMDVEFVPWVRILVGAIVGVVGTLGASVIRNLLLAASGGGGSEIKQSPFVPWIIAVVAQMLGGGIAGTNTRAGAANGFWVGILASVLLVVAQSFADFQMVTHEFLAWVLGLGKVPSGSAAALMIQGAQAVLVGVAGGWFGAQILPAITPKRTLGGGER
jgi:hypothetical protein